ncbi:uncharacterized protein LOC129309058 isoform X2 [Prosopis cineraria]|uniref:uncharacterized protein LOC129309058 isoform X2 n=1 Tax=Prosopis cineraria TaxID=364024 RepID=UPI00240F52C6|nr:uncharacterized protein LOC129309058 isoform X2 [Prosopis cineraria]
MLFKLKNSQGSVRSLFQQALHHHHHHHHYLLMALMVGYDPSSNFTKAFSEYSSLSFGRGSSLGCNLSFPFLRKQLYANVFQVNRCIGFTLQGCFDTNNNNNKLFIKPKARGFAAFPRPPSLADIEDVTVRDNNRNATINTSLNRSPTKPLNFQDCHLSKKLVVAVDVDEVLGNFVSALNRFIADRYSSNYSVSEYHVYEFFRIWNCSRDEAAARVHEFFKTPYFKTGIHPLPGAQTALQKLSRFCNLSVVTSRQNAIKDQTIEWLEKNFPGLFQEIHFGNHFALDGVPRPKSEICSFRDFC